MVVSGGACLLITCAVMDQVVLPCRSDRSVYGLVPHGHLADGRIVLVLVHKCSTLDYLRFMASIPSKGTCPFN